MRTSGPNPGLGVAVLRVVIGVIFVSHGSHKLFQGGAGETAAFLAQLGVPLPEIAAWGVTLLEFFGGVALIAGLLVTPVALLFAFEMLMGIVLVHAPNGWFVVGPDEGGVEFNVLLVAGLLALVLAGPGVAAIDARRGDGTDAAGGADVVDGSPPSEADLPER